MNSYYRILAILYSPCCTIYPCSLSLRPPCPSQSLYKLMSIESMMPSNHLILCGLLLLPSIFIPNILFLLLSYLYIAPPFFPLFTGNHQFVLYFCDLVLYFKNINFFLYGTIKDPELSKQSSGKEQGRRHNPPRLQPTLQS